MLTQSALSTHVDAHNGTMRTRMIAGLVTVRLLAAISVALAAGGCQATASPPAAPTSGSPAAPPTPAPSASPTGPASPGAPVPRFDHVVVAVFENHGFDQVIGAPSAPYLNELAAAGTLLTDAHGVTHPSQPNYLALFAGSTFGVRDDSCPRDLAGTDNLGSQLAGAGLTFAGYAEGMPGGGYRGCGGGDRYARKHNPWVDFTALPAAVNRTFAEFPADFASLPTVSFVVPNLCNDMHDCSVATGDGWARAHLDPYRRWAAGHNSLLIVTWDEDEGSGDGAPTGGHIPTLLAGAHVPAGGRYAPAVDHYRLLRTIEAAYGLPGLGTAAARKPITGFWS
jgi:phosphatidylinositol-3-phosphatase